MASVNSAKKQTTENNLLLRIITADTKNLPVNRISNWQMMMTRARVTTNGRTCVIRDKDTGKPTVIQDLSTKQRFSQPELIPMWQIRSKNPPIMTSGRGFAHIITSANIHPSKHHYYEKRYDYYEKSNPSWRVMEIPRYLRGLDDYGLW